LRHFDDFLFVERFNESFTKFAARVGWTIMPVPKKSARSVTVGDDSDTWDPLMSALDDALYEHALALYFGNEPSLSVLQSGAVDSYFALGPERGCTLPCCHPTCSEY
jgi:hypothetical protein